MGGAGGPRAGSKDPVQSEWPAPAQPWEHTQRRSPLPGGSTLSKGPLSGGSMLSIGAPSLVGARSPKAPLSLVAQVHLRQAERQAASLLRLAHVPEATYTWFTRGATLAGVQLWEEPAPSVVGSRESTGRKSEVASGRHSLAPQDQRHSKARTGPGRRTPRKGPTVGHRSPKGGLMPGWTARLPQLTASSDSKPAGLHPRWAGGIAHFTGTEQSRPHSLLGPGHGGHVLLGCPHLS